MSHLRHSIIRHSKFHRIFSLHLSSLHIEPKKPLSLNANNDSFAVKHFMDKWGFSRYKASKYLSFAKPDELDARLTFLKTHGFTDTQLSKLLRKCPIIIASHPEKTLFPKIQFLHSMGFRERDITALLVAEPTVLVRSLEGCLVPTFNLLRDYLGSVQDTIETIKTHPRILSASQTRVLERNIQILKEAGVPSRRIASALRTQPLVFADSCDKMLEMVKDIEKMGSDPRSSKFMSAVSSKGLLSKLEWKNKLEVYKRWGCSEAEVLTAFKRVPNCMQVSKEKIDCVMDFFVNEMECTPQMVLRTPHLFSFSLQKRIVPRCSVCSKGSLALLKGKGNLCTVIKYSEDKFLQEFNFYPEEAGNRSFTVKYLIDKCGFSRDKAVSASKYVNFNKPDKPDAFLSFFQNRGFTDAQIFKLLRKCPRIIACDPQKILLPKIQFLQSKGFLETDIATLLESEPRILGRSLEGHLVPTFDFLKDHLGSVETTVKTIISYPRILSYNHTRVLHHNIQLLKQVGVTSRCIASALRTQTLVFLLPCDKMQEAVEYIKKIGIDPRSWQFILEVASIRSLSKLEWKNKLEVYRRWDCSELEVLTAFKREPRYVKVSVEKIDGLMDFFVNEMGWTPQMLLLTPALFSYSLQKRIVPRCSVYKLLLSKGMLKVKGSLLTVVVKYSEDKFLEKFINCYPKEAPGLLRFYEEKMKTSMNRYNSEDEFLEKFINCYPEEAPELLRLYEEKIKNSMI